MEENKRVYPRHAGAGTGKWLNYLLLFLSAILLISGLLWRGNGDGLELIVAGTPTPIPTDAAFDETVESREITLPSRTWYALQLGAFENEEPAADIASSYRARGAAGYIWKDSRYRALAALYDSKEDLQLVRTRLSETRSIETYPYEITLPPLALRMRGMKGQLDILEAAFLHGHDLVKQLHARSTLLDQQELSTAEAIQNLITLQSQVQTVSLRLTQRFTAPRHPAVQGLIDMFDSYAAFCRNLDESMNTVQLATEVKYQGFAALYGLKTIYDTLGST